MERKSADLQEHSVFAKPLISSTRICCRNPVPVLVFSVAFAAFAVYWAAGHLGFKMSRLDLINPNSGFNQLWLEYIDEFGENDEVIVVAEGKSNVEIAPVLDALSARIAAFPDDYQGVLNGVDITKIRQKALHYVPVKELEEIKNFTADSTQITAGGHWDYLAVDKMLGVFAMKLSGKWDGLPAANPRDISSFDLRLSPQNSAQNIAQKKVLHEFEAYSLSLAKAFSPKPSYDSPFPSQTFQAAVPDVVAACSQGDTNYFIFPTKDGVIGFVLLKLAKVDKTKIAQGTESINRLRSIIAEVRQQHPSIQIGLTGMPILENDEMRLSSEAMSEATLLALAGVAAVFMAGFGGIRHPFFGMFALIAAFAWTMGYITLAVGHLNILSISFGAMLAGLGTDFSVHYIARYLDLRRQGFATEDALCETAGLVGPGILTGAITTALAFYTASFCEFTGIAELGTISGGGVVFCVLATFIMMPALITLSDGRSESRDISRQLPQLINVLPVLSPFFRFPRFTLFLCTAAVVLFCCGIPKVWYDHNLLHLQPVGLESVELEQKLLDMDVEKGGKNVWYALSIADTKEELLKRKNEIAEKYPELTVEEIVSWFPAPDEKRDLFIKMIASSLKSLPERPKEVAVPKAEQVGGVLAGLLQLPQVAMNTEIVKRLDAVRSAIRRMDNQEYQIRMSQYQSAVAGDLLTRLQTLKSMAVPESPTVNDLPGDLVSRFVGKRGKNLMRIYTTANIWNMDEMKMFVEKVRSIDPKATGSPLQTYESSLQMQQGFITAASYAFAVIFLILLLDFCSVKYSLLALSPMLTGFVIMFGILGWLDLPLNPANMIVLPLILGIGVDDGVHIVHDFRLQRAQGKKFQLSSSTATSILITTLTTLIGFGSMMIASHRGLQSLGRVLVIGVTACFITSLIALPLVLMLWKRKDEMPERNVVFESAVAVSPMLRIAETAPTAPATKTSKRLVRRTEN